MGGEHYTHPGGGANYLCLPQNPKYDKYKNGHQSSGYVYGAEYEVSDHNGDPFKRNLHDHDAPCVVCFVKSRGSMLMMPARNDCPSGWTEEYHQPRPQGFSLKKWVGREKALASAGHVQSLNIPEKLIYMQHAGFALTEGSNNGKQ